MNLTELNLSQLEFLENPILKSNDFESFSKLLMNKKLQEKIKSYLTYHYKILLQNYDKFHKTDKKNKEDWNLKINNQSVRKFMSAFLFLYFPKINNLEQDIRICKNLLNLSRQLKFLYLSIVIFIKKNLPITKLENTKTFTVGYLPVSYSFFSKLELFLDTFQKWKKYDLENLIFKMSYDYYKFEMKMLDSPNNEIYEDLVKQCNIERKNIVRLVEKLDSDYGKVKFREYLDVIWDYDGLNDEIANQLFIQKISNLIHTNTMIEKWDKLELELEDKKYDLLAEMLIKIKNSMKDCQTENFEFHLQLDEVLDESFIISQIESDVFDISSFYKLTEFIFGYLKKFQSPSEDENTLLFQQEFKLLLEDTSNIPFAIRFLLENMYLKFDSIRRQIYIFKKSKS